MKYAVRAVKYFIYFYLIMVIFITILIALNVVEADVNAIFKDGYNSLWKIALLLGVLSAAYPFLGFITKGAQFTGGFDASRTAITAFMEEKGYVLESDEAELLTFRQKSALKKATRMWEDRITFVPVMTGANVEGLRKDVIALIYGLERKLRLDQEEQ